MEFYQITGRLHKLELVRMIAHRRNMGAHGLYFGQMPVLDYVFDHPGCTQIEVAAFMQVSPASIALSTKRLQKAGYLTKEVDQDNLRCKRLHLSKEGECVRLCCKKMMDELDAEMFKGFSEEELHTLAQLIDRVTVNLTGEEENVVNGQTFSSLHRELEHIEKEDGANKPSSR